MLPGKNRSWVLFFFSSSRRSRVRSSGTARGGLRAPEATCSWSPASRAPRPLAGGMGNGDEKPQNNPAGISPAAGLPVGTGAGATYKKGLESAGRQQGRCRGHQGRCRGHKGDAGDTKGDAGDTKGDAGDTKGDAGVAAAGGAAPRAARGRR